ncbi:MAG: polymer-forming cytoskeletal protein [Alphaproteobacteria bacterium]|nr:polymer-forming cytoskeletal protein [Alphaproteobacteria bacterium]MDD9919187.1 polymer-forming cytoskeletal protein [Alphaproteobacteria bacterium]
MVLNFLFNSKSDQNNEKDVSLDVVDPREIDSHCLISGNLKIRGDVYFSGTLRVDGRIDGKVSIYEGGKGQLVVSKGAVINGPIYATTVLADGTISGSMEVVDRLECRSNAIIRGEVTYGSIHIGDGAKIEARCRQIEKSTGRSKDQKKEPLNKLTVDFLAKNKGK